MIPYEDLYLPRRDISDRQEKSFPNEPIMNEPTDVSPSIVRMETMFEVIGAVLTRINSNNHRHRPATKGSI